MSAAQPVRVAEVGAVLGEGPAWDVGRRCLWFVDIKQRRLWRFTPGDGGLHAWDAPGQIGWALPARDGSLIAGLQGALHRFDVDSGAFTPWLAVEQDIPGNRLNDATISPEGDIWFGSMDDAEQSDTGHVYRCAQGRIDRSTLPPVCITNGPALSPDGRTLYHTDTLGRRIYASMLDDARQPRDTRLFAEIESGAGYPDGPVTDAEGCLWTGLFAGWAARRYAPDGRLVQEVRFPVANVTKLAFGGDGLTQVFATTARKGLSPEELAAQPQAGDLFCFEASTPGIALAPARTGRE